MEEIGKIVFNSGLPAWAQVLLGIMLIGAQYYIYRRKLTQDLTERNSQLDRKQKDLKQKTILLTSVTETYFNEKYHIKKRVYIDQKKIASRLLHEFFLIIGSKYEKGLKSVQIDTKDQELLLLAFDGFLVRLKEEIMIHVEEFVSSKDFESDSYDDVSRSITLASDRIGLCIQNTFKDRYSEKKYRVPFSVEDTKSTVEDYLNKIYTDAKRVYEEGESKIDNLRTKFEDSRNQIIESVS